MPAPQTANTHQLISVRYTKSCSHLFITNHAMGEAIVNASNTNDKRSFDNKETICVTDAPNTFLTPISFVLVLVVYITNPNKPRQLMKIQSPADQFNNLAMSC